MSKRNIICLKCGTVQVRTDITKEIDGKYVLDKNNCPKCQKITSQVLTNNVKMLKKQLNPTKDLDKRILNLITNGV